MRFDRSDANASEQELHRGFRNSLLGANCREGLRPKKRSLDPAEKEVTHQEEPPSKKKKKSKKNKKDRLDKKKIKFS